MAVAMVGAAGILVLALSASSAATPPNLVVMFADNLGYGDIGALGAPSTRTPAIDSIGREGMTLKYWVSAASMCSPSRASILTGRYHMRSGIYPLTMPSDAVDGLPANETTLAEHLQRASYATMCIGKWHLGHRPQFLPPNRGFDRFLGLPFSAGSGSTDPNKCSFDAELTHWLPLYNGTRIVESPVDLSRLAIRYAAAATDFIGETASQARPFFLYLPFSHIHHLCPPGSPLTDQQWGGPAFRHRGNAGGVAEAVEEMDWITGQVLGALDRASVTNNTLVIWTADNGPTTSERYNGGTVGPFVARYARAVIDASCTTCPGGYKIDSTAARPHRCSTPTHDLDGIPCAADVGLGSTWEANLRMPAFARWPGHIQAGAISLAMVSTLDVFATGLALAGLPLPTDRTIDSVNMLPVLLGIGGGDHSTSNGTHEFLFHYRDDCPGHCGPHNTSIPFVCPCGAAYPDGAPHQKLYAARRWNWKVHYITKSAFGHDPAVVHDPPLLFNVAADPAEEWPVDPANAPPGTVEAIAAAVAKFEAGLVWGRAMNVREDPTLWPCCTEFPRPVVGPPSNQCRCSLDQPAGNTG